MKEIIIKVVTDVYKIDGKEIFELNRHQDIIEAKQMTIYYLRTVHKIRVWDIAHFLNVKHCTIIHSVKSFDNLLFTLKQVREKYSLFLAEMEKENLNMDFFIISRFLRENRNYMSEGLKEYLKVRL